MSRLIFIALSLIATASADIDVSKSAHRDLGISWRQYRARAAAQSSNTETPADLAVPYSKAHLPHATTWESQEVMNQRFASFRDLRFFQDNSHPKFPRRSTWLYPDDGCYARAALAIKNLLEMSVPAPKKIFVLGDLAVKTPNSSSGEVGWWYHVAPIVEVNGVKWVLDPAIEPQNPLTLENWLARMSHNPGDLDVAICESGTYSPYDLCANASDGVEATAMLDQQDFLLPEWRRLLELKRDPNKELGDEPPWKH